MYARHIESAVRAALADTPVVFLNGARQTGKSTLAGALASTLGARYLTLDDPAVLAAAAADPVDFVSGLGLRAVVDEAQRVPALFRALKLTVDADRRPGRFLLTGSANVLALPRLAGELVGRMEVVTLWPLSQGELLGRREVFIDALFSELALELAAAPAVDLPSAVVAGGFPEAVGRAVPRRRDAWFGAYVLTLLQRDVRDLAHIEGLAELPRVLKLLASRTGGLLNTSDLSRGTGIPATTLKRYLGLLEATFLLQPLPAWASNRGKRLLKSPKVYLVDSGLAAHLTGQSADALRADPVAYGHLLEQFVVAELRKQTGWADPQVACYYYRTATGREVDVVLEDGAGQLVGVEIKAGAAVGKGDFAGLESLAEDAGEDFLRGVVLYTGEHALPFGDRLSALPVSALWRVPHGLAGDR
jgi:hypothetical protein